MEFICRQLVNGYARVTICSELGRRSMERDVEALIEESSEIVKLKD